VSANLTAYVPLAMLVVAGIGGLLYVILSIATAREGGGTGGLRTGQPGWLARRRARGGIAHTPAQVGVGFRSALHPVRLDLVQLNHHGYIGGAPGSGKTTLLRLLVQGFPGPVIALDAKGSPDIADTFHALPGHVWEIGGPLKLDLLDPEPAILAQQLLEGEIFTDRAAVYRAIAEHAVQRAAWVLRWRSEPAEPARILTLISSPATLAAAIRSSMPPMDPMAMRWLVELDSPTATIREAYLTFGERLGGMLDSPVGRSLGTGANSLRLADVVASNSKLLVRLDPRYGQIARKVGAWTLVAMLRLAAELRQARWEGRCLFVVDEPRLLGHEGRHLADLFGTARDAGLGLIVADQGIAGLATVHADLPDAILRSTGWQVILRQGSPADAEKMAALFGTEFRADTTTASDGRKLTRQRREPRVHASALQDLPTGSAWLRIAPIGTNAREQIERLAIALPVEKATPHRLALPPGDGSVSSADAYQSSTEQSNQNTLDEERASVLELVEEADQTGCRAWRGSLDKHGYARAWWRGRYVRAGRLLYAWQHGEIQSGYTLDHVCRHRWCVEIDHLEPLPRAEHARREAERRRQDERQDEPDNQTESSGPPSTFAIALFNGIDRPSLQRKDATLLELTDLLTLFDGLNVKRDGRCWSPTRYVESAVTRGDDGVASVSCLVFDLDRVPPEPARLAGLYWIAHTTWSHRPEAPRWRVVVPLARPVPVSGWHKVWQRARAALCPEADPSCKDASRQYFLPSFGPSGIPESSCHDGEFLDPATLPALPEAPGAVSRGIPALHGQRRATQGSLNGRAERYMSTVISNLSTVQPGNRNCALNQAAWSLGRWVAAGALDQATAEDQLYAAAQDNGLVADDGERQTWATIRSGIGAGLQSPRAE
jgi:hypothetical protein